MFNFLSIDLSMRSSGISFFKDGILEDFSIVSNVENNEELIINNIDAIITFINKQTCLCTSVVIEGLSFGSKSGSIDIISGQHWYLRCELIKAFPNIEITVIPVTSWRSPLFTKADRVLIKIAKDTLKKEKLPCTSLKGEPRKEIMAYNKQLELNANIKEWTWKKLEPELQKRIIDYISNNPYNNNVDGKYDITDSIFLGRFYANSRNNGVESRKTGK